MKKLLVVQPVLTEYRKPVFEQLGKTFEVVVACAAPDLEHGFGGQKGENIGFETLDLKTYSLRDKLFYQRGVLCGVLKHRPDIIHCFANFRYLSSWILPFLCLVMGIKFFWHGQGLYSKPKVSPLTYLMYRFLIGLSDRYICYTRYSFESLLKAGLPCSKLAVAENSMVFNQEVEPNKKKFLSGTLDILFVGRLRQACGVKELIEATELVRMTEGLDIHLHVVGGGVESAEVRTESISRSWIHCYGEVYDQFRIKEISQNCLIGCYPGDCGLSVLHYMSLSLIPLIHDRIETHMGPEPSYIKHEENGILFRHEDGVTGLASSIRHILQIEDKPTIAANAYSTYRELINPPLSQRLSKIYLET